MVKFLKFSTPFHPELICTSVHELMWIYLYMRASPPPHVSNAYVCM